MISMAVECAEERSGIEIKSEAEEAAEKYSVYYSKRNGNGKTESLRAIERVARNLGASFNRSDHGFELSLPK